MSSRREIGVGAIGVEAMGELHTPLYTRISGVKVIAVADINE